MDKQPMILAILTEIQSTSYSDVQSIDALLEYGFRLTQHIAFSGEAMSEAKKALHDARRKAYLKVESSMTAQEKKWAPSLIKDYVNDCAANENAYYELCERCNRSATHSVDLIRTAVSALKTEMQTSNFQNCA
jgi:hypothetical protein